MARPRAKDKIEKDLGMWRQRIVNAESYLNAGNRLSVWREVREYYLNRRPTAGIGINLLFAIGRAMIPQLYFKSPTISARPSPGRMSDPAARLKAKIVEAVDTQLIEQNSLKSQYKLGILDCYRFNISVLKHGYATIGTELPETAKKDQPLNGDVHPAVEELLGELGFPQATETDALIDEKLRKYSYHGLIHPDSPWSLRTPPEDFLVPWGTRNSHEAPWCAFVCRRPLEDVKADPVYKKSVTADFKANWGVGLDSGTSQLYLPFRDKAAYPTQYRQREFFDEGWLIFYEIWDKREGRVMALTLDQGEDFMRHEEHNLPIGLPVSIMQFNEDGEDFWGLSDAAAILPLVKELNETRTIEMGHKKITLLKLLIDKNVIDAADRTKLASDQIAPIILTDGPPQQAAMILNPSMSRDLFNISEVTRDDIREVIGFSRNSLAEFEVSRRTATEANIVQQNLMLRGDERRDLMADHITDSFRTKTNPMIFKFWKTPRYIEVTGIPFPVTFIGSGLKDDYALKIAADSTIPVSKAVAKQEADIVFKTMKGDPNVAQAELYRFYLEQFDSVPVEQLLIPPEQAAALQMQMMLLMGSIGGGQPQQKKTQASPTADALRGGPGA